MIGHRRGPSGAFRASSQRSGMIVPFITRGFGLNDRRGRAGEGCTRCVREVNDASVNPPVWRERPKQGRRHKDRCEERGGENSSPACPICVRRTCSLRACRDYEAASEIENVPTARTLRHTRASRRKTVFPTLISHGRVGVKRHVLGFRRITNPNEHAFIYLRMQIKALRSRVLAVKVVALCGDGMQNSIYHAPHRRRNVEPPHLSPVLVSSADMLHATKRTLQTKHTCTKSISLLLRTLNSFAMVVFLDALTVSVSSRSMAPTANTLF